MRKNYVGGILVVALAATLISGCVNIPYSDGQTQKPKLANLPGKTSEWVGDWIVTCIEAKRNSSGSVSGDQHCRLEKYDRTALVSFNSSGGKVMGPGPHMSPCDNRPKHFGVDGRSMVSLPFEEQVRMMKIGKTFGRQKQRTWPKCWISEEETDLRGFAEAYEVLILRAKQNGLLMN